ncbi:hypothetical protein IHQ71_21310 [Rhizobium sp. TH2]|uniref:hypothetical protein n=1 Tax=Rhizobium sp. TH2 TaxID=2775403 RepID=UPI002157AB04|nr:hypothetical protein [Rhizobium sp. TH2]UVC07708.1 hypothetical protein IHQ71_21310 [Rhizobium sp. TH2]
MQAIPTGTSADPVQFLAIKRVYETLVSSDWFYDTEDTRQDLSDLIMRQYRRGYTNEADLLLACATPAKERYSAG